MSDDTLPIRYDQSIPQHKVDELKQALDEHNTVIRFKDEGYELWWHAVIAWFVNTFVLRGDDVSFEDYITTLSTFFFNIFNNKTYVYFPSRRTFSFYDVDDWSACWHELRHSIDDSDYPIWYKFSYALVLPAFFTMRSYWEYRGYATDLAAAAELMGSVDDPVVFNMAESMKDQFTGPNYAYMDPFEDKVDRNFSRIKEWIREGRITKTSTGDVSWMKLVLGI